MVKLKTTSLKMASLFCGCGGGDLGFSRAGFNIIASYDNNRHVVDIYNQNLNPVATTVDLTQNISLEHLRGIDVLLASPPCQGFSTIGKRIYNDPRNFLLNRSAMLAVAINPKIVIIENVSGVVAGEHKKHWDMAHEILRNNGYYTIDYKVNCVDIGITQKRKRMLLFAFSGKSMDNISLAPLKMKSLAEILDIPAGTQNHNIELLPSTSMHYKIATHIRPGQKLCDVRGGSNAVHSWDIPEVFGKTTIFERKALIKIMQLRRQLRRRSFGDADPVSHETITKEFGSKWTPQLENNLIKKGYLRKVEGCIDIKRTFNGNYKRLNLDSSAPTVDTKFGCPKYFLHPIENRGFSVREAARIQTFPDNFIFNGPFVSQYQMIGNAIPPDMAYQIAVTVREILGGM